MSARFLFLLLFGIALTRCSAATAISKSLSELDPEKLDEQTVQTHGLVVDASPDEADHRFDVLLLKDGPQTMPVVLPRKPGNHGELVDARIRISGILHRVHDGQRANLGPYIGIVPDSAVEILETAADPFSVPLLKRIQQVTAQGMLQLDRRRIVGTVLAVWGGDKILLNPPKVRGGPIRVELARKDELPAIGTTVTVSGYPESDSFRVNLVHARCRTEPTTDLVDDSQDDEPISTEKLSDSFKGDYLNAALLGKTVRLEGIVRTLPLIGGDRQFVLEFRGRLAPVDVSACPDVLDKISVGCRVRVTGVCYIESPQFHPYHANSQAKGCMILLRSADDFTVLAQPPWWTPFRIWLVIGLLVLSVLGILIWNATLRILINRRGRALFREQLESAQARLRTEERTRLAVELHDAISQNLTGASMQIDAARKLLDADRERTGQRLDIASTVLASCREELRNCIWELKNDALEEPDMNRAIARTLERHIGDARLSVRFNVPRKLFSDRTAHALLSIVRELAVNAVRHGHATEIRVAGGTDGNRLLVSVRDNGCGFDPSHSADASQGHFGLQGIRERLKRLHGTLTLDSSPATGTRATIVIVIHEGQPNGVRT